MDKYNLTVHDIELGINRLLAEAYATSTMSSNPEIIYISAGPGAGKTSVEVFFKQYFKDKGEKAFVINSDSIAKFHPQYEDALLELPAKCYEITRQFVRPATPKIFEKLREKKINLINENTLDKGDYDIEQAQKFKEAGYKISVNIMATDLYESIISCYEREAATLKVGIPPRRCEKSIILRMYNGFIDGIKNLNQLELIDEINVYIRGENINKPPIKVYGKGCNKYQNFEEAVNIERQKQRQELLSNPLKYYERIENVKATILKYEVNEDLKNNSISSLNELMIDLKNEQDKARNISDR